MENILEFVYILRFLWYCDHVMHRNIVKKQCNIIGEKNFRTYKSCYISGDNMSEATGFWPYIRCNFHFSCVIDLLLHL